MGNHQSPNRFEVQALESKKFLEWLRDFDTIPAPENFRMITDKTGRRVQGTRRI